MTHAVMTLGKHAALSLLPHPATRQLNLAWIPPASFVMGESPHFPGGELGDGPFPATITSGYWIGVYPVTQEEWVSLLGSNPSRFSSQPLAPVEMISWEEAVLFCNKLNGLLRGSLPPGYQFSLPTEMQWEFACRAGTRTRFNVGPDESDLARAGWYAKNSGGSTHPVGEKEPNGWGLYDFHGNVAEWCLDWASDYPTSRVADWHGLATGAAKIIRGGSYGTHYDDGTLCSGGRNMVMPDTRCPFVGVRIAVSQVGQGRGSEADAGVAYL